MGYGGPGEIQNNVCFASRHALFAARTVFLSWIYFVCLLYFAFIWLNSTASYYRGAHGIVIVYDISNKESFKNVKHWVKDVELYASENVNRAVIGNKCDITDARQVSKEEGKVRIYLLIL